MLLLNAFSLNMLASLTCGAQFKEISLDEARKMAEGHTSAVGHVGTAAAFAVALGMPVRFNRATISLNKGDELLVGQYIGPRLGERVITLPPGATIKWVHVTIQ